MLELLAARTRDGRYRFAAHKLMNNMLYQQDRYLTHHILAGPGSTEQVAVAYLLADDETREAVLIDPVLEQIDRDLDLLKQHGLKLVTILDTHVHADHITGAAALKANTHASTAVPHQQFNGIGNGPLLLPLFI